MLNASNDACALLWVMLTESDVPESTAARFVIDEDKLALQLDDEKPGDASFIYQDRTVLLVDENISQILDGKTLDIEHSEEGPQLTLV